MKFKLPSDRRLYMIIVWMFASFVTLLSLSYAGHNATTYFKGPTNDAHISSFGVQHK